MMGKRTDEYLKRFKDVHEINEFTETFNCSFDCASKFIKSFDNAKEASTFGENKTRM